MSRICQITGRRVAVGNNVSHSNKKTKRKFCPNLKVKRFWFEEEKRFVKLKVSAAGMRTINKNGLKKAMEKAVSNGHMEEKSLKQ